MRIVNAPGWVNQHGAGDRTQRHYQQQPAGGLNQLRHLMITLQPRPAPTPPSVESGACKYPVWLLLLLLLGL